MLGSAFRLPDARDWGSSSRRALSSPQQLPRPPARSAQRRLTRRRQRGGGGGSGSRQRDNRVLMRHKIPEPRAGCSPPSSLERSPKGTGRAPSRRFSMGHPPHPRVTPSGKGGSWRPRRGGKPSSERRSAAGVRLINLGPSQSRRDHAPEAWLRPRSPAPDSTSAAHGLPSRLRARAPETPGGSTRSVAATARRPGDESLRPEAPKGHSPPRLRPPLAGGLSALRAGNLGSRGERGEGSLA